MFSSFGIMRDKESCKWLSPHFWEDTLNSAQTWVRPTSRRGRRWTPDVKRPAPSHRRVLGFTHQYCGEQASALVWFPLFWVGGPERAVLGSVACVRALASPCGILGKLVTVQNLPMVQWG